MFDYRKVAGWFISCKITIFLHDLAHVPLCKAPREEFVLISGEVGSHDSWVNLKSLRTGDEACMKYEKEKITCGLFNGVVLLILKMQ